MEHPEEVEEKKLDVRYDQGTETSATFIFHGEDHTLGNALRYALMRNPNVEFAGYSIPNPAENAVILRVQTIKTVPATQALTEAVNQLDLIAEGIRAQFQEAVASFQSD